MFVCRASTFISTSPVHYILVEKASHKHPCLRICIQRYLRGQNVARDFIDDHISKGLFEPSLLDNAISETSYVLAFFKLLQQNVHLN